ncbi:uncharacterized protein LOC133179018 [Saccostrea echinata]|uniref:uncharacterized protein LOC133179018 n=1 Tax=Saccostrea echinata TaxID=191078 RepID=UPI002A811D80|nr:uncharacterized protein LOC133179018 [Saccostrea echinata]
MLRGAVTTGRKTDLIERLEAYERNFNLSGPVIELSVERKVDWPTTGYEQITSEHYDLMPHISEAHIEGSPIKAEDMPCRYNPDLSDPRPQKYRGIAGHNDYVSNIVTNYCALMSADLSFKYMKPKAFIKFAVLDHDYLDLPFTEYWTDAAQNVSDRDIARIEHRTRKQNLSKVWHQERE